ncbi:MAG: AAA family ATPase [Candidatus Eisenbacteria bacterium]
MKAQIISLINNKGGTGRTTAAALAMHGEKMLLVGLDSQGSASLSMEIERAAFRASNAIRVRQQLSPNMSIRAVGLKPTGSG